MHFIFIFLESFYVFDICHVQCIIILTSKGGLLYRNSFAFTFCFVYVPPCKIYFNLEMHGWFKLNTEDSYNFHLYVLPD